MLGVMFFDSNGKIIEANDSFLESLGYAGDDLTLGIMSGVESPARGAGPRRDTDGRQFLRKDGSFVTLLFGTGPQQGFTGKMVGFTVEFFSKQVVSADPVLKSSFGHSSRIGLAGPPGPGSSGCRRRLDPDPDRSTPRRPDPRRERSEIPARPSSFQRYARERAWSCGNVPRRAIRAVVLAHAPPGALAEIRAPTLPIRTWLRSSSSRRPSAVSFEVEGVGALSVGGSGGHNVDFDARPPCGFTNGCQREQGPQRLRDSEGRSELDPDRATSFQFLL